MRTTITFDPDTAAQVEHLRRERAIGVSAAVNELIRRGLMAGAVPRSRFVQQTSAGHARLDVTNVAEVIELVDGPAAR